MKKNQFCKGSTATGNNFGVCKKLVVEEMNTQFQDDEILISIKENTDIIINVKNTATEQQINSLIKIYPYSTIVDEDEIMIYYRRKM